jgi:hypothetical protein
MVFGEAGVCAVIGRGARRDAALARPRRRIGPRLPGRTTTPGSSSPRAPPGSRRASRSRTAAPRRSSTPRRGCSCRTPARHPRPGARRAVRRFRRLLRGDVAGLAARRLPGAAPRSLVRSGRDLGAGSSSSGISVVSTVPTLARAVASEQLTGVRLLILGGEACPESSPHRLAQACPRCGTPTAHRERPSSPAPRRCDGEAGADRPAARRLAPRRRRPGDRVPWRRRHRRAGDRRRRHRPLPGPGEGRCEVHVAARAGLGPRLPQRDLVRADPRA